MESNCVSLRPWTPGTATCSKSCRDTFVNIDERSIHIAMGQNISSKQKTLIIETAYPLVS